MREFEIKPHLLEILLKLSKKNNVSYEAIMNKIEEIINSANILHYKNLRYNMKEYKRVHLGHFVLVFSCDKLKDFVSFDDYDHHDNIYC